MKSYIDSITDREGYIALGRTNTTPHAPDDDTYVWTGEATHASVWDAASEEQRAQAVAWVREGEAQP